MDTMEIKRLNFGLNHAIVTKSIFNGDPILNPDFSPTHYHISTTSLTHHKVKVS